MKISKLLINQMINPLGISDEEILFTWQIESGNNMKQKRYDLEVSLDENFEKIIWHQNEWSDESIHLKYRGPKLMEKTIYYVRVRIIDTNNNESDWSAIQTFETGILVENSWQSEWVTTSKKIVNQKDNSIKPFSGMKKIEITKEVKKARLYVSSLGIYSAYLNNKKIGNDYFTPGWTDYNNSVQFQTYDLTNQLEKTNELTISVAEGWFSGYLGWEKKKDTYGNFNAFIAQVEIEYQDDTYEIIKSDSSWVELDNQWLKSDIYNGEEQDLRKEISTLDKLKTLTISKKILVPQINEPVRKQEEIKPDALFKDHENRLILDLGQNMVGWIKCQVKGQAGQKVSLIHGEILDKDGNFYRNNIRDAKQKDDYILTGEIDILEPNFTFHGFRYVHLENFPETVALEDFKGIVLHSDMAVSGKFETSNTLLNQLQSNILWSQKGNFLDVPTDCPQRDERLGWTADAQMFLPTASFNMNTLQFFKKWLKDMNFSQHNTGEIPFVVPDVLKGVFADNASKTTAAWGDAATIIPWELYQKYGDLSILEDNYSMMARWVNYIRSQGEEETLWNTGLQLGDWLALDAEEGSFFGATDETLLATSYFAHSTEILANTAKILGHYQDYKEYSSLFSAIKEKIVKTYFSIDGKLLSDTQTAYIIVLMFKLYPKEIEKSLVSRLVELIEMKDKHLDTGFIGTPYICQVLSDYGETELAYHLLFNEDLPSWLFQVKSGATTVWEHFDGIKADGSFWDDGMNSFNHYAYGSVGNWMYENIGGIQSKSPGYKQSIIAPKLHTKLTTATTSLETLYGELKSQWKIDGNQFTLTVHVPANTEAEVILPKVLHRDEVEKEIITSWNPIRVNNHLGDEYLDMGIAKFKLHQQSVRQSSFSEEDLLVCVGSGNYTISYELKEWGEKNEK